MLLACAVGVAAHRTDEYEQAARILVGDTRAEIALDLTPGTALAPKIFRAIDSNHDGRVGDSEGAAYAKVVLSALRLALDGRVLTPAFRQAQFASLADMASGRAGIRIELVADYAPLAPGEHHVVFGNDHRPDVSAYLANALVPSNPRITISSQVRDRDQREIRITFALATPVTAPPPAPERAPSRGWWPAAVAVIIAGILSAAWFLSTRRGRGAR